MASLFMPSSQFLFLFGFCILFALSDAAYNMQYTTLGSSSIRVSKICLGTMTWGEQNSVEEGVEQLEYAFSRGINFLDTAEMYPIPTKAQTQGATDRIISKWLKTQKREDVVLATKVAGASPTMTYLPGREGKGSRVREKDIIVSVEASLQRLGTDYIDLLQIHWPDRYAPIFGQLAYDRAQEREAESFENQLVALNNLIKSGKVRAIGLSNETPFGIMKFAAAAERLNLQKFVSLQNSYSLINRVDFDSSINECCSPMNENISLLPYSPLAGGILTGKYALKGSETTHKNSRLNLFPGYMARYRQSQAVEAVEKYRQYADSIGLTCSELALGWCYKQSYVASTIIGATTIAQLSENLNAYDEDKMARIDNAAIDLIHKDRRDPSKL